MSIFFHLILSLVLCLLLYLVAWAASFGTLYSRGKVSPFECGFDPSESSRVPFSLRFFLLAIIFLIFDIEVVLLVPLVLGYSSYINISWCGFVFGVILVGGLLHEWRLGSLSWLS